MTIPGALLTALTIPQGPRPAPRGGSLWTSAAVARWRDPPRPPAPAFRAARAGPAPRRPPASEGARRALEGRHRNENDGRRGPKPGESGRILRKYHGNIQNIIGILRKYLEISYEISWKSRFYHLEHIENWGKFWQTQQINNWDLRCFWCRNPVLMLAIRIYRCPRPKTLHHPAVDLVPQGTQCHTLLVAWRSRLANIDGDWPWIHEQMWFFDDWKFNGLLMRDITHHEIDDGLHHVKTC